MLYPNELIDVTIPKCPMCDGTGKVWVGERDPIEGNKMRSTADCQFCCGLGIFPGDDDPRYKAIVAYNETFKKAQAEEKEKKQKELDEKRRLVVVLTIQAVLFNVIATMTIEELEKFNANITQLLSSMKNKNQDMFVTTLCDLPQQATANLSSEDLDKIEQLWREQK